MNGKEIEIKVQLQEKDYIRLIKMFNQVASFRSQKHQVDVYYSPAGMSFYNSGDRCLRVRTEDGNTLLSYKRIYDENTSKQFIEEYETRVDSFDMIDHILKGLCFRREIIVDKFRLEYSMEPGFFIFLDKVDGLGHFIEIENRNEKDTIEKRNHDLYEFANQLQVDITHRNTEGYSNMLFRKSLMQGEDE